MNSRLVFVAIGISYAMKYNGPSLGFLEMKFPTMGEILGEVFENPSPVCENQWCREKDKK
jgi:hypothetical protein